MLIGTIKLPTNKDVKTVQRNFRVDSKKYVKLYLNSWSKKPNVIKLKKIESYLTDSLKVKVNIAKSIMTLCSSINLTPEGKLYLDNTVTFAGNMNVEDLYKLICNGNLSVRGLPELLPNAFKYATLMKNLRR